MNKIANKISSETITSSYSGICKDDLLFIEIAANRLLSTYKEEAKVTDFAFLFNIENSCSALWGNGRISIFEWSGRKGQIPGGKNRNCGKIVFYINFSI